LIQWLELAQLQQATMPSVAIQDQTHQNQDQRLMLEYSWLRETDCHLSR